MNLHAPQSIEAATELRMIAAVPLQIVSPRESVPIVSVVQDTLVGANRFTRPNVLFTKKEAMNLLVNAKRWEGKLPPPVTTTPQPMWSGQQLLSALLPPVSLQMANTSFSDADKKDPNSQNLVKILNGTILQGILDKSVFSKQLIHIIYNDYGPEITIDFLDSLQAMIATFLMNSGFSVGISDLIADQATNDEIGIALSKLTKTIEEQILQVHTGLFENSSGRSNQEEFEGKVLGTLNKAVGEAGKIGLKSLADTNRMTNMVKAGSKGSDVNVSQMIATLGQQAIEGKRVPNGFQHRTLPHFKRFDDSAQARGFITSSYIKGLQPDEFFFHAMSGREGLIDTAVKTADTGYMQRQIRVALEDLITQHDGSVRDTNGNLLQVAYGEDGINATKLENQQLPLASMSDDDIATYAAAEGAPGAAEYLAAMLEDRRILVEKVFLGKPQKNVKYPVHLDRLACAIKSQFYLKEGDANAVTPTAVLEAQKQILLRTHANNRLWAALIRYHLAPSRLISCGYTQPALDALAEEIVLKHWTSWVEPGQPVGVIAAQSIGEPATQMSTHYNTKIVIHNKNLYYSGPIGAYIDKLLEDNQANVKTIGQDSVVLDLDGGDAIIGVSTDEKTSWLPIKQVSRHPANGGLVEVRTRTGRITTATLSHSFLKRTPTGIAPILGAELKVGDRVPVAKKISEVPNPIKSVKQGNTQFTLNKDFGWLCGMYLADGSLGTHSVSICKIIPMVETKMREIAKSFGWTFRATHYRGAYGSGKNNIINSKDLRDFLDAKFGHGSFEKYIHADVFHAPVEFISGLIGGYFDGDGNISVERQHIRVSSRNETLLRDINRLLGYCGLYGYLGKETSIRMPDAVQYTLNIPKSLIKDFQETIGLQLPEKAEALNTIANYKVSLQNPTRSQDMIDKIPALGEIIAETGKLLALPGQSRNYGRWAKKESIGRETLISYLPIFKAAAETETNPEIVAKVNANIYLLESAAYSDVLWDEIVELKYHEDPHTFVYDFTVPGNDSFMVDDNILVHNTLNSVDWDTEIMIAKDGKFYAPKIGEFIDNYIQTCNQTKIQYLPNDQIYVPLEDGHEWSAVSTDEYGQMMWTKLEAITKHPVVNEDGTDTILEVMTESGRVVRATKGKSFLTLRDGKFLPLNGSDLKIGDELPVANTLAIHQLSTIKTLDVSTILSPMEYLYGTEAQKALNAMKNADEMGQRHWFSEANGREFMVPYSRSDAFRDAFANGKNTRAETFLPGFVYPKSTRSCSSQIPSTIELTKEFGFFVGAYLSEGSSSTTQIQITNNDKVFLAPIRTLLDSWSIGHHTTSVGKVIENTGIKGRTTSLIIHSTLLTALMRKTFGHISYEKTIPDWVYQAPNEFVLALLDGYFSGDGSVALDGSITCSSVSEALIIKLSALLTRYSIFGTMSSYMPKLGKFKSVSRQYAFRIPQMYAAIFAKIISLTIMKKQERLNKLLEKEHNVCKYKTFNDVVLDKVKSIVPIHPKGGKVYDVTVKHTRNFTSLNQVCHRDTFHLSGVSSKSAMTRGVPRLKELLKVTRNPKAVELTIPLRHDLRGKKEEARRVSKELEFTLLQDIVTIARIYFDPKDTATLIGEDQDWLAYLAAYEKLSTGGLLPVVAHDPLKATQTTEAQQPKPTLQESEEKSPWILRFELDREKMFNKNITMDDIAMILRKKFSSDITSLYTDYNAPRLVFRIRLNASAGAIDDLNTLKTLQNKVLSCTAIRGIPGLRVVNYQKVEDTVELRDGKYVPAEQYILISDGSNFLDVITHPDVDPNRIVSSNVHDMFANLGIEATRATLCKEITTLFADAGSSVNYRHVCILLDKMCHKGRTMSIDRYGINKNDIGPLAKMSFEQTEDIALRAAIFGERDPVLGISSKVMLGAPIKAGTAFSEIMLDEAMTIQFNENAPEQHPPENIPFGSNVPSFSNEEIQDALYGGAEDDSECSPANLHIPIMLPPTNQLHKQMPMDTITETDDENSGVVIYE